MVSVLREKDNLLIYRTYGKRKSFDKLDELIQGGATTNLAFQKKEERISFDGQKDKKKDKSDDKQQK